MSRKNHLLFCACLLGAVTAPVFTVPVARAQAQSHEVNVPAQSLASALAMLSKQTGIQILAAGDLVAGRQAPAVTGRLTVREALNRLLAGSGLEARATPKG